MSVARRIVVLIAVPLLILQIVLIVLGHSIGLIWFVAFGLIGVNAVLWQRDAAYQAGLEADAEDEASRPQP